jgi:hypothetical protein
LASGAERLALLGDNLDLLCIAAAGGLVLFGYHLAAHFNRKSDQKFIGWRYVAYVLFLLITLPSLALIMAAVYILNGDKMSAMLAFQVGISSPVLAQSLVLKVSSQVKTGQSKPAGLSQ